MDFTRAWTGPPQSSPTSWGSRTSETAGGTSRQPAQCRAMVFTRAWTGSPVSSANPRLKELPYTGSTYCFNCCCCCSAVFTFSKHLLLTTFNTIFPCVIQLLCINKKMSNRQKKYFEERMNLHLVLLPP